MALVAAMGAVLIVLAALVFNRRCRAAVTKQAAPPAPDASPAQPQSARASCGYPAATGPIEASLLRAKRVQNAEQFNFEPYCHAETRDVPEEFTDEQRSLSQQALSRIQAGKEADLQQAFAVGRQLKKKYPRFYFGYYIVSLVYHSWKQTEKAEAELREGVGVCYQKSTLYAAWGSFCYDNDRMNEAVAWWIKSAVMQVHNRKINLSTPFLFLGYAAKFCGLEQIAMTLFEFAGRAHHDMHPLDKKGEDNLYRHLQEHGSETIHQALVVLYTEHLSQMVF
ncbi:MAG: hypothetical protein NC924_04860 [Candidatus Omnitrophica bacterium]|nr:hypothetical protein [Candidatus Omnitrophota bacterium]